MLFESCVVMVTSDVCVGLIVFMFGSVVLLCVDPTFTGDSRGTSARSPPLITLDSRSREGEPLTAAHQGRLSPKPVR